jgi:hypothetical protein
MKHRFTFSVLACLFLALLVISNNKEWMTAVSDYRFSKEWLAPDQFKHGDLYGLCYIHAYKEPAGPEQFKLFNAPKRNLDLYILHDSYLQNKLPSNCFEGIDTLIQIDYRGPSCLKHLNPAHASILLIETAQRYARWRFQLAAYFMNTLKIERKGSSSGESIKPPAPDTDTAGVWNTIQSTLYNPNINTNLEFNLFDYSLCSPLRGFKASLNYALFKKLSDKLVISTDQRYLLLKETIDTSQPTGIYTPLPDSELDSMVAHMDQIRKHFLSCGFKEVYFSVLPNTVSIVDSTHYPGKTGNGLLYKLNHKTAGKIPFIDAYTRFLTKPDRMYKHGDSHWSNEGKQIWIDLVNKTLSMDTSITYGSARIFP